MRKFALHMCKAVIYHEGMIVEQVKITVICLYWEDKTVIQSTGLLLAHILGIF